MHTMNHVLLLPTVRYLGTILTTREAAYMQYNFEETLLSVCLCVCLYVCMYVCMSVCNTITVESLDVGSSFSHILYISGAIRVMFVYEYHGVKFKVTGANVIQNPYSLSQLPHFLVVVELNCQLFVSELRDNLMMSMKA